VNRAGEPSTECFVKSRKRRGSFAARALLLPLLAISADAKQPVTFVSPCECMGNHGVSRWAAKTDLAEPPTNDAEIKKVTSSQILAMPGPGGKITTRSERIAAEHQWYAVTGRIEKVKTEDDGDIHIVLRDVNDEAGMIVEIPLGPRWCELRKLVFSWTTAQFPLSGGFQTVQHPIVTVTGKIFYDIDHSGKDTRINRRNYDQSLAVWEIHPVMKIAVETMNPPPARKVSSNQEAASSPSAAPSSQPTAPPSARVVQPAIASDQFVTLTKPVTIQIQYGSTVLPAGTKLPVLSRDAHNVDVRYMDARYSIPISSTDAQR
jgi:hypothetical protein